MLKIPYIQPAPQRIACIPHTRPESSSAGPYEEARNIEIPIEHKELTNAVSGPNIINDIAILYAQNIVANVGIQNKIGKRDTNTLIIIPKFNFSLLICLTSSKKT